MRNYWLSGLLLVLVLGGIWLFLGRLPLFQTASLIDFGLEPARELYQRRVLWLSEGTEIRQTFVSEYPGLYQVSAFLTSQGESNRDITLVFHLKENCRSPEDLRRVDVTITETTVSGELFYPFTFDPIDESTNQEFCFILEPMFITHEENVLGVWASGLDVYSAGEAFYEAPAEADTGAAEPDVPEQLEPVFGNQVFLPIIYGSPRAESSSYDVGFQLHYNGRSRDTINVFIARLVAYKPYFWGKPWFYGLLLIMYLFCLVLLSRIKAE